MTFRHIGNCTRSGTCLIFSTAVSAFALGSAAWAQDTSNQGEGLEEIVVTAQRRAETLQSVPIQVAAFSAAKIEDAGMKSTRDFVALVPNVTFDETSLSYLNSFIAVRGVSQLSNADSPVAFVVDGVPQNSQKQQKMNLFDVERIEVLKGPQGGLYGRNAIGGAINIITKSPSDVAEGFVQGTYGRGDAIDVTGGVSIPLADEVGLRMSGAYMSDDGRIENAFTGKNVDFIDHDWELRAKLNAALTDAIKVDVRTAYRDFDGYGPYVSVPAGRADDYQAPRANLGGVSFGDIFDASGKIDIDLGGVTLTSITAHTDIEESYRGDGDSSNPIDKPSGFLGLGFPAGQAQALRTKLTSQELRLVSDDEAAFRWILGAYYLDTSRSLTSIVFVDIDGTYDHVQDPAVQFFRASESNENSAYAGYANVDYDIGEHLTLSGALRYDYDHRRQIDPTTGAVRTTHFSSPQPKATITYKFTPERLVYATYSNGFRSGGFNSPAAPVPVFRAEELQNYEVGFKTSWLSNRLIVNGAAYRADDDNMQYFDPDPIAFQVIDNIDRVRITGVELDVQALVARGLQLFASVGTTDTEILRNRINPSVVGNKTPKAAPWTTNVGFQYEAPLSTALGFMVRVDYQHRSKKYWEADNIYVQEPLDLVNARVGLQTDRWSIFAFGRNVLDEKYYTDFGSPPVSGIDTFYASLGQPASYGIEMRYKF